MSSERTEKSRTYLDKPAIHEAWESDYLNPDLDKFYDRAFQKIVEAIEPASMATILDAGCGYCYHAVRLADAGLQVTGVDFSSSALAQARPYLDQRGLSGRVDLRQADLLQLPFENDAFDFVNCWGVLMHIPELERALTELARVVKPGGKVIIMENNVDSFDVVVGERIIRSVKHLIGRPLNDRTRVDRGIEEWNQEDKGGLMVRKLDINWLERFYADQGLQLVDRFAGQFTELYTNVPTKPLKRVVYAFNRMWLERIRKPGLALGNILIFQKKIDGTT
jgi:ubiquinone/menaquinone biosynthesis C-methylase UbiE